MVAIGLIEDFGCRCIGRCEPARGVGLADRKEPIAPAFLCIQHLFFGDVVVHAHHLAVGQCGTGSRNQQGQAQSAEGGGQTNVHDDSVSQGPWNCKGPNRGLGWPGLLLAGLRNCRQTGFVIQLAIGEAIGVLANAQDQKWGGLSALEPTFAPVFCILTLEGSH